MAAARGQSCAGDWSVPECSAANALVIRENDRERDVLDGDGVAVRGGTFCGEALSATPCTLITSDERTIKTKGARKLPRRATAVVRGRLTNLALDRRHARHGYRGCELGARASIGSSFRGDNPVHGLVIRPTHRGKDCR